LENTELELHEVFIRCIVEANANPVLPSETKCN